MPTILPTNEQFQAQFKAQNPQYFTPAKTISNDFNTALANLTPAQRDAYLKANPNVNPVGGAPIKPVGIVGSNDPLLGKQTGTAINNAGNAITGPQTPQNTLVPGSYVDASGKMIKPGDPGYKAPSGGQTGLETVTADALKGNADAVLAAKNMADRTLAATQLQYNADLASTNLKYGSLFNDLKSKYTTSLEVAQQNAIALNPYSTSRGATVATNFKQKITDNYNSAATQLQAQADIAQQQLAAGNYKAYIEIQNGLDKIVSDVTQKNNTLMLDFTKQVEQSRQFEVGQKNIWADNFRQQLTSIALEPTMVDEMVRSGSIYNDPTYQAGIKSGYSPEGVIESMKTGSLALKKQQDLETYRTNQLAIQNERLIASQDKMTAAQMAQAAATSVFNTHNSLISQGIKYGTPEYAQGLAQASRGGTKPSQIDRDRYGMLDAVSSSLDRIKSDVNALGDNNQLWNIVSTASKNPFSSEVTKFTAQMAGIATQIGKGVYGEGGRLSDDDVRRILSSVGNGYQKENVREGLFNELLKKVVDAGTSKLISDANAGVDVSNYGYTIQSIRDRLIKTGTSETGANTYQGFTLPY